MLGQLKSSTFNPHQKWIYLFGGETRLSDYQSSTNKYIQEPMKMNTLYQIDIGKRSLSGFILI